MPISDDSLPPAGKTLRRAFETLVATLNERQINYAIIGGLAVIQHTRIRTTDDIDALLSVPQLQLPGFLEALASRGFSVDLVLHMRQFRENGFTSFRFGDVTIDLLAPIIPTYAHVLASALTMQINGQQVKIGSAEGLIVTKLIAMRPQDEADIRELLSAYAGKLDLDFIRRELEAFTDAGDPRRDKFESWLREASAG